MDSQINIGEILALNVITKFEREISCMTGQTGCDAKELEELQWAEKKVKRFLNQNLVEKSVVLTGLKNAKHLNGVEGKILKFHVDKNLYEIQLSSKQNQIVSVQASNLTTDIEENEEEIRVAKETLAIVHHCLAQCCLDHEMKSTYYAKSLKYYSSQIPKTREWIYFWNDYLLFMEGCFNNITKATEMHHSLLEKCEEICGKESCEYAHVLASTGRHYAICKGDVDSAIDFYLKATQFVPEYKWKAGFFFEVVQMYLGYKQDLKNGYKFSKIGLKFVKDDCLREGFKNIIDGCQCPKESKVMLKEFVEWVKDRTLNLQKRIKCNKMQNKLIRYVIMDRRCRFCNEINVHLRACLGCEIVYYCNKEHQNCDWQNHKKECKQIQKQRLRCCREKQSEKENEDENEP